MYHHFSTKTTDEDLKFDVAAPTGWAYAAGDTIIGNLVRSAEIIAPEATVKIDLIGRVTTEIKSGHGDTQSTYKDDRDLISSQQTLLYQGPVHLPANSDEKINWEFSVKIPSETRDDLNVLLPLNGFDHNAQNKLPPAFSSSGSTYGKSSKTSINYYLKASLRYKFGDSVRLHEITWPIKIRYTSPKATDQHRIRQAQAERKVQSQRLLPGMQNAQLSLSDKTRKLFHSSKAPEFHFRVTVSAPMAMRFNDPEPIPITLQFDPLPENTSAEIRDVPQELEIESIKIKLHFKTEIRIADKLLNKRFRFDTHVNKADFGLNKMLSLLESPLTVSTGKGNEPLHLGNIFHLTLREFGMTSGNKRLYPMPPLHPDFATHGLRHTHGLETQVTLKIAGETVTAKASLPLKLLSAE